MIAEGDEKLVLAYRPFGHLQPYAEVGPIFLHAGNCARYASEELPAWFAFLQPALVRGYGADDWIRYASADVVPGCRTGRGNSKDPGRTCCCIRSHSIEIQLFPVPGRPQVVRTRLRRRTMLQKKSLRGVKRHPATAQHLGAICPPGTHRSVWRAAWSRPANQERTLSRQAAA